MLYALAATLALAIAPAQHADDTARDRILVVAAKIDDFPEDHYLWAAEIAAARLPGNTEVVEEGGFAGALRIVREEPGTVQGIVEIVIDVYRAFEEVVVTCMDPRGKKIWRKKSVVNAGGPEETLARNMLNRALNKAEKQDVCGS